MEVQKEVFGVEIDEDSQMGRACFFRVEDILFIDVWEPKKNYRVPRFHTKNGIFTVSLTLEACRQGFPNLVPLDIGNLVNLDQVDYIDPTAFEVVVRFKNSKTTTNMARYKLKYFKHLLKKNQK